MEYQVRNGIDSVNEADVTAFMAENKGKWKQAVTYENHIREYFGFPKLKPKKEDNQLSLEINETLQSEPSENIDILQQKEGEVAQSEESNNEIHHSTTIKTRQEFADVTSKTKKTKRIQVSVYLEPETYEGMRDLAGYIHMSIGDILSKCADTFVTDNQEALAEIRNPKIQIKFR